MLVDVLYFSIKPVFVYLAFSQSKHLEHKCFHFSCKIINLMFYIFFVGLFVFAYSSIQSFIYLFLSTQYTRRMKHAAAELLNIVQTV